MSPTLVSSVESISRQLDAEKSAIKSRNGEQKSKTQLNSNSSKSNECASAIILDEEINRKGNTSDNVLLISSRKRHRTSRNSSISRDEEDDQQASYWVASGKTRLGLQFERCTIFFSLFVKNFRFKFKILFCLNTSQIVEALQKVV